MGRSEMPTAHFKTVFVGFHSDERAFTNFNSTLNIKCHKTTNHK